MALYNPIDLGNGVTVAYHKISAIDLDYIRGDTNITLRCYVSADIRAADAQKYIKDYQTNCGGLPDTADARQWAYAQVKTKPDFAAAKDV